MNTEGSPGFVDSDGEAACLFHAVFRGFRQDFEEWELIECLIGQVLMGKLQSKSRAYCPS